MERPFFFKQKVELKFFVLFQPGKCHLGARAEGSTESECGHGGLGKVPGSLCGSVVSVQVFCVLAAPDGDSPQAASPSPAPPCRPCAPRVLGSRCCLELLLPLHPGD